MRAALNKGGVLWRTPQQFVFHRIKHSDARSIGWVPWPGAISKLHPELWVVHRCSILLAKDPARAVAYPATHILNGVMTKRVRVLCACACPHSPEQQAKEHSRSNTRTSDQATRPGTRHGGSRSGPRRMPPSGSAQPHRRPHAHRHPSAQALHPQPAETCTTTSVRVRVFCWVCQTCRTEPQSLN